MIARLPADIQDKIPIEKMPCFFTVNTAHIGAYLGGVISAIGLTIWAVMKRVSLTKNSESSVEVLPSLEKRLLNFNSKMPRWLVGLLGSVVSMILTFLLLSLEPGVPTILITVGAFVFLIIIILNPLNRYFRVFNSVLGVWAGTTIIPTINLFVELPEKFKGAFVTEGPPASFHWACVVLMIVLLVLDFAQRNLFKSDPVSGI